MNGGSDYISVDIYIDDYADVEIGILDAITLGIIRYPSPTQWENTFAEVRTSMMLPDPPNLDCYVPVVYPLHNFGGVEGASASWVIKQNGTPKASGTGSYAVTSNISDGAVDLEFTVTFPGEDLEPLTFSEEYGFGIFNNAVITGTTGVCPDSYYIYTCQVPGGHSGTYSYSWTYPSNWMWPFQADNTIRLKTPMYNPDYGTVRAKITNACGTSSEYSGITVYPGYNCGGYYMASPNPTVEYTEIDIASEEAKALDTKYDSDITLTVVDKMGAPISKVNVERLPYRLNTSKLPKGEYIIQIISQPKDREALVESLKIIVNH